MPWNITDIQESIHIKDSAKYSRNKLDVFGNMKQKAILPDTYTQVDYIESSGSQYIDTGIIPNINQSYEIKFSQTNISGSQIVFGSRSSGAPNTSKNQVYLVSNNTLMFFSGTTKIINESLQKDYIYQLNLKVKDGTYDSNATYNTYIFALNNAGLITGLSKTKLYSFKIFDNEIIVRDFIPCFRNSDNEVGLYDLINNVFYTNQGSEAFTYGSIANIPNSDYPSMPVVATGVQTIKLNDNIIATLDLGKTELCKITDSNGNVVAQDRAVYREVNETMKWQFEKQIKKLVITGTTFDFKLDKKDDSGKLRFLYSGFNCYSSDFWVCDKLKVLTYRQFINPKKESIEYICGGGNYPRIYIKIDSNKLNGYTEELTDAEVVTLFKEFLNENNITVYYIQGTSQKIIPEYEDCTVEQSEVLDKLYKLQLEKGINNIFVESENGVTTELQLEYMQDNNLKKEQKNKALEDRITAIENLLSTTQTSALLLDNMQSDLEKEVE